MSLRSASAILALASAGCVTGFEVAKQSTLATNAAAPNFSLHSQHDEVISLGDATRTGPAVFVFYRGYW
ncbi:MAG TPA: hypothetical protein VGM90_02855 [Kofleriaceae bacterium]|jgi:hypothetical protein